MILLRQTRRTRRTRSTAVPFKSFLPTLFAVAALTLAAPAAHAQVSFAGVEASLGRGAGRGGDFWDRTRVVTRVGAAMAVRVKPPFDLVLGADYERVFHFGDYVDMCVLDASGGCRQLYPQLSGPTLTAGLRWAPDPGFQTTTRVGGGLFHTTDDRGSHRPRDLDGALVLRGDVAMRMFGPCWLVVSASHLRFSDVRGDALHISPIAVGLRLR